MLKWLKTKSSNQKSVPEEINSCDISQVESTDDSMFERLKRSLTKTRNNFGFGAKKLLFGKKIIDAALLEELENLLLEADVGLSATQYLLSQVQDDVIRSSTPQDDNLVLNILKSRMRECLSVTQKPTVEINGPLVILMVGVNGAGKTTTIGKLAHHYQAKGKKVLLAAGDTFRAAAVEQLQVWGERNQVNVIAQHSGADSASVIFDALLAAKARNVDVLIADTAGRLHTQNNLMEELKKIKRVMQKIDVATPHEVILVLDASIGQNALNQAKQFNQALGVTGIILTKLDGTAKGGIVFAIAHELSIPFIYLGTGEGLSDLREFDATQFVDAIFEDDQM